MMDISGQWIYLATARNLTKNVLTTVTHSRLFDNTEILEGLLCFHRRVPSDSWTDCYVRFLTDVHKVKVFVAFISVITSITMPNTNND